MVGQLYVSTYTVVAVWTIPKQVQFRQNSTMENDVAGRFVSS